MRFSLIAPCYNNENEIDEFCKRVMDLVSKYFSEFEIILVNDNSTDNTWNKINSLCKKYKNIKEINLNQNLGQHYATFFGMFLSKGEYVTVLDADLEDDINLIETLIKNSSVEKAIFVNQKKIKNNLLSYLFWKILSLSSLKKFDPGTSNFFIAPKIFVDKLKCFGFLAFTQADLIFLNLKFITIEYKKLRNYKSKSSYNYYSLLKLALSHLLKLNFITIFFLKNFKINFFLKKFEKKYIKELKNFNVEISF